jgi:hypothetical protein
MPGGPPPKDPSVRARNNKHSTHAVLRAVPDFPVPQLPDDRDWHPRTTQWWDDLWSSPMGPEYDHSDVHGLIQLAELVDLYNITDTPGAKIRLAAEIRQQRTCFGLTPIDRRRLQWTIDQGEEAEERTAKRRQARVASTRSKDGDDPRALLA